MGKKSKVILVDADVVSHFIKGGEIYLLPSIFPYKMKILDKVYDELKAYRSRKVEVDNLINHKVLEIIPFPENNYEIRKEYYWIKKVMFKGDGESATLAVVRYTDNIIGSSNLKDIKNYCEMHSISYLTTMDFLCRALKDNKIDITRCNEFIKKVINAGGKLPVNKIEDYKCRELLI